MDEKKQIELHNGEDPRRRVTIDANVSMLVIPVRAADGFGQISYMASGLHTEDGAEIWTPQKWERQ